MRVWNAKRVYTETAHVTRKTTTFEILLPLLQDVACINCTTMLNIGRMYSLAAQFHMHMIWLVCQSRQDPWSRSVQYTEYCRFRSKLNTKLAISVFRVYSSLLNTICGESQTWQALCAVLSKNGNFFINVVKASPRRPGPRVHTWADVFSDTNAWSSWDAKKLCVVPSANGTLHLVHQTSWWKPLEANADGWKG